LSTSATVDRDLHTGVPVWTGYPSPEIPTQRLAASLKTDVVVVGAGVTGAMVAEALTRAGLQTVILDRRPPARGSTAASTALLQFEIDTPLIHLADQIGMAKASRAWLRSYGAVGDLARLAGGLDMACDFRPRSALYLAGDVLDPVALVEEGRQRRSIGLPSQYLSALELKEYAGIDREAALLSHGAADVNPVLLTDGLLQRATAQGARVFSPVQLAEVAPLSKYVQMVTADGIELQAKALVFATGYELADGVPSKGHRYASTWAFATPPQPQNLWPNGDVIWEAADPYLYVRTTRDGRVIVGGEDESIEDEVARDKLLPAKTAALQAKAQRMLPGIDVSADFAWTGTFGESDTGLPSIGAVPAMPNCYAVLGYGGNGITFSMVAAQIVSRLVCGESDPDVDLFAFD
jgi:glycine/D-amino acid oxidase-like deaminating enzyme